MDFYFILRWLYFLGSAHAFRARSVKISACPWNLAPFAVISLPNPLLWLMKKIICICICIYKLRRRKAIVLSSRRSENIIFFPKRAEFSKSCNLISSVSGRAFIIQIIVPTNPGGIVACLTLQWFLLTHKHSTRKQLCSLVSTWIQLKATTVKVLSSRGDGNWQWKGKYRCDK